MKKVLRFIVLVLMNLITLPLQLLVMAIILLTERTDEEDEALIQWAEETVETCTSWIKTGRIIEIEP